MTDSTFDKIMKSLCLVLLSWILGLPIFLIFLEIDNMAPIGILGIVIIFIFVGRVGYYWINDSKKGKIFYAVLPAILSFLLLLVFFIITLGGWTVG
ncbi:MAG: hypothetical protein G01um10145_842 [Microgenomates group bacterium Gr01-1014_5]|nr:MAG: hypothetical protein G01um10145_842 [Microgenomates group bacterium Gr01-1014_5]